MDLPVNKRLRAIHAYWPVIDCSNSPLWNEPGGGGGEERKKRKNPVTVVSLGLFLLVWARRKNKTLWTWHCNYQFQLEHEGKVSVWRGGKKEKKEEEIPPTGRFSINMTLKETDFRASLTIFSTPNTPPTQEKKKEGGTKKRTRSDLPAQRLRFVSRPDRPSTKPPR